MFKNILKLVGINTLIITVLLFALEFIMYKNAVVEYNKYYKDISKLVPAPDFLQSYKTKFHPQTIQFFNSGERLDIRPFETNKKNNKKPILLFGCSFTNGGHLLNDNQTVSYKLSQLTSRNVYNFGMCGCGLQHMLYIIQNYLKSYMPTNEKPEYAIYFYIPNQIQRLRATIFPNLFFNGTVLHYKIKNDQLEVEKKSNSFLYRTYLVKTFYYYLDRQRELNFEQDRKENFELARKILIETKNELNKLYPDIKFIIVRYQIENDDNFRELPNMWEILKEDGFTIINSKDLIGRKYKYSSEDTNLDNYHPSEKAWDILLPPLIKKLDLN